MFNIIMPRSRRMRGGSDISKIQTANRDLLMSAALKMPKPPMQPLGQITNVPVITQGFGRRRMRGGAAYVDKYGAFVHAF